MKWIGQHIVESIARFKSEVYLEELSIKEIVEITSIVNPTIKTILHRGRKNLFKKFKLKSKKNGVQ